MSCCHDASYQSTLRLLHIRSVETGRQRWSCACDACKRMTDWYAESYEAQLEAWCGNWMKEE